MDDPFEKISAALYGNGRPGLLERVNKIETEMNALQKAYHDDVKCIHNKLDKLDEYRITDQAQNEIRGSKKWFTGMLVSTIASFMTAVAAIITLFLQS